MKRTWRFIKWFFSKCGWFEALMFITSFTLAAGLAAGEGTARNVYWGIAIGANALAMLKFMWWGAKNIWQDFKKHDEEVFEILKKEKIDGQ
jgi:hypothetical protein